MSRIANRTATYTLARALEHCASHRLEELESDPARLNGLAEHQQREDSRLEAQVHDFYRQFRRSVSDDQLPGAFQRSWTLSSALG